ncbi:ubiquitin fusion degradation protein [Lobulomyces angularis]|nr:ubiquitin fusion degradation protein [Lobulomyces angularis]
MGVQNNRFEKTYRCYSILCMQGNPKVLDIQNGGKIFLPPSALLAIQSMQVQFPLTFHLSNHKETNLKSTHAGVLEFNAEEGRVYVPQWLMVQLMLNEGDLIKVKYSALPLGTYVKIQAQSVDFLEIHDHRAVLEKAFRNYGTLTEGDIITINYNNRTYDILVMETKPKGAISIVETDLQTEFAAPLGYQEPTPIPKKLTKPSLEGSVENITQHVVKEEEGFSAFHGSGQKLSGKKLGEEIIRKKEYSKNKPPPALVLPAGRIFLGYKVVPLKGNESAEGSKENIFSGEGKTLRASRKGKGKEV